VGGKAFWDRKEEVGGAGPPHPEVDNYRLVTLSLRHPSMKAKNPAVKRSCFFRGKKGRRTERLNTAVVTWNPKATERGSFLLEENNKKANRRPLKRGKSWGEARGRRKCSSRLIQPIALNGGNTVDRIGGEGAGNSIKKTDTKEPSRDEPTRREDEGDGRKTRELNHSEGERQRGKA